MDSSGDVVAVGYEYAQKTGKKSARLVRMSPFGHVSCAAAGVCGAKSWTACADGNACTTDNCLASLGCTHAVAANKHCPISGLCATSARCSSAGQCVNTPNGKLFTVQGGGGKEALPATIDAWEAKPGTIRLQYATIPGFHVGTEAGAGTYSFNASKCGPMSQLGARDFGGEEVMVWGDGKSGSTLANRAGFCLHTRYSFGYVPNDGGKWRPSMGVTGGVASAAAADLAQDGSYWLLARLKTKSEQILVGRASAAGALLWQKPFSSSTGRAVPQDVAAHGNGGAFVAYDTGSSSRGAVFAVTNSGGVSWSYSDKGSAVSHLNAIVSTKDGGCIAAGAWSQPGAIGQWTTRLSLAGKVMWSQRPPIADGVSWQSIAASGEVFIVAGSRLDKGLSSPVVAQIGGDGASHWLRANTSINGTINRHGIRVQPDGGLLLLGTSKQGTLQRALAQRANRWGYSDCSLAGGCFAPKPADCDDGDKCTIDSCSAKAGCHHTKIPGCS